MSALPEELYTASQLHELERRAIESARLTALELMQRAGVTAWEQLKLQWPGAAHVVVFCGGGNNAGDGYALAALALADKRQVTLYTLGESMRLPAAAAEMRGRFLKSGGEEKVFTDNVAEADVLVDALLGIGLDRPLEGRWLEAVRVMNASGKPVLALDIPTGLHADTGAVLGAVVQAASTVSFIGLKAGLFTGTGPECAGLLRFSDLGMPASVYAGIEPWARRMRQSAQREMLLPRRRRDAHKGDFGHLLIVGGDLGMGGAVRLAAEAALRSGAGLVSVATRDAHAAGLLAGLPEAMTYGAESPQTLTPLLAKASVVAIGPGLGRGAWGKKLLAKVLASKLPLVMDADALNLLAAQPVKHGRWVLTPHPGEAGRLLGSTALKVQQDRYLAVAKLAAKYKAVVVLKGAGSLVAEPGGTTSVCTAGNPGMAAAGMGDVLTGVIAAFLAQGMEPGDAARNGVYLHALAGDLAARQGERGLMARDLIQALRQVVNF
ncbi:MAG TPA: NAD(P)H-hydrate dehydratase [Gammaproteobacteria bacterium]|nr:NAD(P)H-hydrate dehydratase [Gammaproteobacteria bacterium]